MDLKTKLDTLKSKVQRLKDEQERYTAAVLNKTEPWEGSARNKAIEAAEVFYEWSEKELEKLSQRIDAIEDAVEDTLLVVY